MYTVCTSSMMLHNVSSTTHANTMRGSTASRAWTAPSARLVRMFQVALARSWRAISASHTSLVCADTHILLSASSLTLRSRSVLSTITASSSSNCYGKSLGNSSLSCSLSRVHSIVDREVEADVVSTFCGPILGELLTLARLLGGVFPTVDTDSGKPSLFGVNCVVNWLSPLTALAKTWWKWASEIKGGRLVQHTYEVFNVVHYVEWRGILWLIANWWYRLVQKARKHLVCYSMERYVSLMKGKDYGRKYV